MWLFDMSYGEGGKMLAVCVIAVVLLGSILALTLFLWNPFPLDLNGTTTTTTDEYEYIDYSFSNHEASLAEPVTLDFLINSGGVDVNFVDDPDLLFEVNVTARNDTVLENGPPEVSYLDNRVYFFYQSCEVTVTLGKTTNYIFDFHVNSGSADILLNEFAHVSDMSIDVNSGRLDLTLRNGCTILGNASFELFVNSGMLDADIEIPSGLGAEFFGYVNSGERDIVSTWELESTGHYRTDNYDTATQILTITSTVNSGILDTALF
jgi:hypothetical protein